MCGCELCSDKWLCSEENGMHQAYENYEAYKILRVCIILAALLLESTITHT